MNRYAVIAIFVTIMILALGGMHTHLMDLKKAKMAEKKKVKVERVKQEVVVEDVEEEELEFDDIGNEDIDPQLSIEEKLRTIKAPVAKENDSSYKEIQKTNIEAKPKAVFEDKLKPQKESKNTKNNVSKNSQLLAVKQVCKMTKDDKFLVSYDWEMKGNTEVGNLKFIIDFNDVTENNMDRIQKNGSYVGDTVGFEFANSYCLNKNSTLPNVHQFKIIHEFEQKVCNMNFIEDEYWTTSEKPNTANICSMVTGQCREVNLIETKTTELHRARCVN